MKIAITGSTGFIGKLLVPILEERGVELLLLGRNASKIKGVFPRQKSFEYNEFIENFIYCDVVLHLAAANNDMHHSEDHFNRINVDFTYELANSFKELGVNCFINTSSFHCIDGSRPTLYSESKEKSSKKLRDLNGINIINLYIPSVYGDRLGGSLKVLNIFPKFASKILFSIAKTIKPSVNVSKIAEFLCNHNENLNEDIYLYDDIHNSKLFNFFKRMIDLSFALFVSIAFSWLFLLIWILIQVESGRPGIFAQERIGRNGKPFTCYKFRTMKQSTIQTGTHDVPASAVTKVGGLIRSTKLDELPQVWNIFRNEMSLVGPRPCLPMQTEIIEARNKRGALKVMPGITGLAQVRGIDMSQPDRLAECDFYYVATSSIVQDFRIIMATFLGQGRGDRVRDTET